MGSGLVGPWRARATGDVTLSVLAASGLRILTLDLVRSRSMRPSKDGRWLARAYNNLGLLAAISDVLDGGVVPAPSDRAAGTSPFPWHLWVNAGETRIRVTDRDGGLVWWPNGACPPGGRVDGVVNSRRFSRRVWRS